jgi:hypothetical protein
MGQVTVRERLTEEQHRRRKQNAGVLDEIDAHNRRLQKDADRRQSDIVREGVDRYGNHLRLGDAAPRNEKAMREDMKRWVEREGIRQD